MELIACFARAGLDNKSALHNAQMAGETARMSFIYFKIDVRGVPVCECG
jgi:hypothetical protein